MGGMIGATSGKFVMMAAALLFQGRVEGEKVHMALVPSAPDTVMTSRLAAGTGKDGLHNRELRINIRAENFAIALPRVDDRLPDGTDIQMGQDVLNAHPIEIDFRHHQLRPLTGSEMQSARNHMAAIQLEHSQSGWTVPLEVGAGQRMEARLDLASPASVILPVNFVPMTHANIPLIRSRSGGALLVLKAPRIGKGEEVSIGLAAFQDHRVIFDLGHDRIWIDAATDPHYRE